VKCVGNKNTCIAFTAQKCIISSSLKKKKKRQREKGGKKRNLPPACMRVSLHEIPPHGTFSTSIFMSLEFFVKI
jgi:hypothetical protein